MQPDKRTRSVIYRWAPSCPLAWFARVWMLWQVVPSFTVQGGSHVPFSNATAHTGCHSGTSLFCTTCDECPIHLFLNLNSDTDAHVPSRRHPGPISDPSTNCNSYSKAHIYPHADGHT